MGYPLYGHELSEEIDPLQAGLGFFVDLQKPDFVGKSALVQKKTRDWIHAVLLFSCRENRPHHDPNTV